MEDGVFLLVLLVLFLKSVHVIVVSLGPWGAAQLFFTRWELQESSFGVVRAGAALTVLVSRGGAGWGGHGFGLLFKVSDYYSQVSNGYFQVPGAAPVYVF